MTLFYSPSISGFFDPAINPSIPADAVEITAEQHAALMAAQGEGKVIMADADGYPIAADPIISADALWSVLRARRDAKLTACDWTQMPDSPLSDADKALWATYRQALRDLPALTADPANPIWPEAPQ